MHSLPSNAASAPRFVVATPQRSVCDHNARALERVGALRFIALGTRRGTPGVPRGHTRLNPAIGLAAYACAKLFSMYRGESLRFRLHPWFDRWVLRQLRPGDCVISSYGYANACFEFARTHGGRTFLDGGNAHIEQFWSILVEEHRRWNCPLPPVAPHYHERVRRMMPLVDFVLSPSSHVTRSFLERGFKPGQILRNVYPVDLSLFHPAAGPRPKDRPLTVIATGALSLRKGAPYLLEAFRLLHQRHPSTRFRVIRVIHDSVAPLLARYRDLPVEWSPPLPHAALAGLLRSADVFVLPSLEEGLARAALEAMACGLQVVLTPNTGANDFVQPGVSGEVVPIRDSAAIADAVLKCAERVMAGREPPRRMVDDRLFSVERFEEEFLGQLRGLGLLS